VPQRRRQRAVAQVLPVEEFMDVETGVVDGDAERNPHDEHRRHVDRMTGGAEDRADDRDRDHVDEHGACRQDPVAQREVEQHEARYRHDDHARDLSPRHGVVHVGPEHRDP
jgi:hypothetical protein